MLKDFSSNRHSTQSRHTHLRLVVSNPLPTRFADSSTGFRSIISQRNQSCYTLMASDLSNDLACELALEIENDQGHVSVVCKFPPVSDEQLDREGEKILYLTLLKFQMKIMEQLLSFAIAKNAADLLIQIDEECDYAFAIYQEIAAYEDKIPTLDGKLFQMTIPSNNQTWERWIAFTEGGYLKSRLISKIVDIFHRKMYLLNYRCKALNFF